MQNCINEKCRGLNTKYLDSTYIYTTLEPCMMCAGMMIFLEVSKVIYGQTDIEYGKNIERLQDTLYMDKQSCEIIRKPNSREMNIKSLKSKIKFTQQLEDAFDLYIKHNNNSITDFSETPEANAIFQNAYDKLLNYNVLFPENIKTLKQAQELIKQSVMNNHCYCKNEQN